MSDNLHALKIGDIRVTALSAGRVRMDGGAIFGVVPKPLWSKRTEPDESNRVDLQMWCLLVEAASETILIETGFGGKVTERLREIYDLREEPGLVAGLSQAGKLPEDIDRVILTHLHQDHAGGATIRRGKEYAPAFPNAIYTIQSREWRDAREADAQTANAYRIEEVLDPLERSGQVNLVDGDQNIGNGIRLVVTPGHTRAHQSVLIQSEGESLFFVGDLVPTASHLRPIYVMAYDMFPRETFLNKERFLGRAASEQWWVAWPHDPQIVWGKIEVDDREGYVVGVGEQRRQVATVAKEQQG